MNKKEFKDLAEEMEASCEGWERDEGLSEETLKCLHARVAAMEERASVQKHRHLKKRYVVVLAAALILLMGMGTMGGRAWISKSNDLERNTEMTTKVNNEEKASVLLEEEQIYQEIAEKLGIAPMWLGYMPEGMELHDYTVMEGTGRAFINYFYEENLVCIQMIKDTKEISGNIQWDGEVSRLENISNRYAASMNAYCINKETGNYTADIIYGNAYYSITGTMEETEFVKLLEEIYFKN